MKKLFASLAFSIACICFNNPVTAQIETEYIHLGVGAHVHGYLGNIELINPGLNIRVGYDFDERWTANLNFNYGLPRTVKQDGIDEYGIYNLERKFNFIQLGLVGNYYFSKTNEDDFGLYGILGVGINFSNEDQSYTYTQLFFPSATRNELNPTLSYFGPFATLGIGGQTNIDFAYLFGEATFNFPSGTWNSRSGLSSSSGKSTSFWGINVGLRFQLGDR